MRQGGAGYTLPAAGVPFPLPAVKYKPMTQKLLFVYNAETGLFNKLTDFAHKAFAPKTYACNLCALTYGTFTIKQEWVDYLKKLPLEVEFIYKSEWKFAQLREQYPLVALQTDDSMKVLLEAAVLNDFSTIEQLEQALDKALQSASS